jgi:tetratricopeptide (TPR) repeat protein
MLWRWLQDWREQRSVLRELTQHQREDELRLMGDELNPLNLAKLAVERDQLASAATRWEDARERMPNFIYESQDSLEILLGLKRYDEAEALMREGMRRSRLDRRWLKGLARIAERRGDYEEAARRWRAAQKGGMDTTEAWIHEGICLRELGRLEEADGVYLRILHMDSSDLGARIERARVSDQRQDWVQAEARWRALTEHHQRPHIAAGHARALAKLGRSEEADTILERTAASYPADLDILLTRAHVAEDRGDMIAACERWAELQRVQPYFKDGFRERVKCLLSVDRHAEADAVMREAIDRFRNDDWPQFDYAILAHQRQDWPEAAVRWQELRRRFPGREEGFTLGKHALSAAGRHDEAAALRP